MSNYYNKIAACTDYIRTITDFTPRVGLVLGSGLGAYAENMDIACEIPYGDIPGFPVSTVAGHDGRFIFGAVGATPVIAMKGRVHYYEGYSMQDVTLGIRVMAALGVESVIITNAVGGINKVLSPGDFMLVSDHIASFVPSPLRGENVDEMGTRFPDMSDVYDAELRRVARRCAYSANIPLREGVLVQSGGPAYETPAEVSMYGMLGADAVGMSSCVEAMVARHCGVKVCGISCISNMASGVGHDKLDHTEVQETADRSAANFEALITSIIEKL